MKFHSTTNNIVPCLTKMLEDKFQISNLTSMMFQYQLLLQQFQLQLQPIAHKANQSMHREPILSKLITMLTFQNNFNFNIVILIQCLVKY